MGRKDEGRMTGGSATKTGAMAGRYLRRLKHSVGSGETNPEVLRQKKAQAERIKKKIGGRYGGNDGFDDLAKEGEDKFADAQKGGEGRGAKWYHAEDERAPDKAPNPTDVKRRAKGKKPYRQRSSTNIVRGARLALAERVLAEMYSGTVPKGSKARRDMSNKVGMESKKTKKKPGRKPRKKTLADRINTRRYIPPHLDKAKQSTHAFHNRGRKPVDPESED